jgi:hypothetical protein
MRRCIGCAMRGGEPAYIARRLVRPGGTSASPSATVKARPRAIGARPSGDLSGDGAQIERRLCRAWRRAQRGNHGSLTPPAHILNAPTKLMPTSAMARAQATMGRMSVLRPTIFRTAWRARFYRAQGGASGDRQRLA